MLNDGTVPGLWYQNYVRADYRWEKGIELGRLHREQRKLRAAEQETAAIKKAADDL